MSVAEISAQITEIQARLAMFAPQRTTSAGSGTAFASALSGATAAEGTTAAASATGSTLTGTGVTGDDVVQAAAKYEGVPYVLGGESRSGIDCSGLVQAAFKDLGVDVPRLVHQQKTIGQEVGSLKDAKPGDLIVLNGGDHIAIWAGDGKAIHAPYPGRTVSEQQAWFTDKDVVTIRRVVPATDDATSGTTSPVAGATAAASTGGLSAAGLAQATALLGMYGASSSGTDSSGSSSLPSLLSSAGSTGASGTTASLSSVLSSYGTTGSGSTAQQLLAARSALLGSGS